MEYGGIGPLIGMMIQYSKESVKLMRQACWAVLTLSASDDIAASIAAHGADTAILSAMLHHRCVALLHLHTSIRCCFIINNNIIIILSSYLCGQLRSCCC